MTPIEIRLRCVEIADKLHTSGVLNREDKVLDSAQKVLNFVTDSGVLSDVSAGDITTSLLDGITEMITGLSALNSIKESDPFPFQEEIKAEKKAKVVKTPAEDKSEA